MAVKISIKPELDDEEDMAGDGSMPEAEDSMAKPESAQDELTGMAEGNEDLMSEEEPPAAAETGADQAALADVVPDANPDLEGRIAALEAQLASAKAEAEQAPSPTAEMGSPAAPAPRKSEWDTFETDYPDIAGPIRRLLEARTERYGTDLQAIHTRIFEEAMDAARPDWRDLRENPEFSRWIQAHPDQQQAGMAQQGTVHSFFDL